MIRAALVTFWRWAGREVRELRQGGIRAVLDCAGRGVLARTSLLHRTGTRVFSIAGAAPGVTTVYVRPDQADLIKLVELVESQSLTVRVAATYPLDGAARSLSKPCYGDMSPERSS
jgi:hypothetical protein